MKGWGIITLPFCSAFIYWVVICQFVFIDCLLFVYLTQFLTPNRYAHWVCVRGSCDNHCGPLSKDPTLAHVPERQHDYL